METKKVTDQRRVGMGWTNERHVHFLNTVEASFVRTMLEHNHITGHFAPPMERYLPDSSDTTLDLKADQRRRRRHSASDILDQRVGSERRGRRLTYQPYTLSTCEDQVVPQLETRNVDDDHKDGKDHPAFSFAATLPHRPHQTHEKKHI